MIGQVDRSVAQAKAVLEASLIGDTNEASPVKAEGFSAGAGSGSNPAAVNGKRRYCCATLVSVDAVVPVLFSFSVVHPFFYFFSGFRSLLGPCLCFDRVHSGPIFVPDHLFLGRNCFG